MCPPIDRRRVVSRPPWPQRKGRGRSCKPAQREGVMRVVAWAGVVGALLVGPSRCATAQEFDAEAVYRTAVRSCALLVVAQKDRAAYGIGTLIDVDQRLILTSAA